MGLKMNDFTKEELGLIYTNLCETKETTPVLKKITKMYDSYCAHKNDHTKLGITVCLDCKKIMKTTHEF